MFSVTNIIIYGIIIALLVGLVVYHYSKDRGLNADKGFAWGFLGTLAVTAIAAFTYFFKNKRR